MRRIISSWALLILAGGLLLANAACTPAATQSPAQEEPTRQFQVTGAPPAPAPQATQAAPATETSTEGRVVEMEWPEYMRLGDSDVIRLALVPSKDGYVARAEFPDHNLQTKEVAIPRPNGYSLYAIARLDGVGFDITPAGEQERFVPENEEVAWRWSFAAREPGQQRLSVQMQLRWVPAQSAQGAVVESQAFARGLNIQVRSFFGLSTAQASTGGLIGLFLGGGCLLLALLPKLERRPEPTPAAFPLDVLDGNQAVQIEAPTRINVSGEEAGLLKALFHRYSRVYIENEFLSGYSGARTFLLRPIRADGGADAQTIVKLGPASAIRREYQNYETFVKDRLPPVTARIQRRPAILKTEKSGRNAVQPKAAIQYTFIAEPGHSPVSLRQSLLNNPDPTVLRQLFETFGPSWWMQRRPATFRLGQEYDRLLPPHYVLEPTSDTPRAPGWPVLRETDDAAALHLTADTLCLIEPFSQTEIRADGRSLTLTGVPAAGQPPLRLRWLETWLPRRAPARIVATRMDLLRATTAGFERFGLPDPLERFPALMDEMVSGTYAVIHGDLNLENILVGPGNLVWLIDFAQTRDGHPLYDFAHLESELIAHVLCVHSQTPRAYLERWQSEQDPLLSTLHAIAGRCLFDPAKPREYRLALAVTCLGALKYQNLSPLSRHCLYLTAADLMQKL